MTNYSVIPYGNTSVSTPTQLTHYSFAVNSTQTEPDINANGSLDPVPEKQFGFIVGECLVRPLIDITARALQGTWHTVKNLASTVDDLVSPFFTFLPTAQAAEGPTMHEEVNDEGDDCDFQGATVVKQQIQSDGTVKRLDTSSLFHNCRVIRNLNQIGMGFGGSDKLPIPKRTKISQQRAERASLNTEQLKEALFHAVKNGDLSETTSLLKTAVDVDSVDSEKNTPLHWAAKNGELSITRELIKHHANPNILNDAGGSPLHFAILNDELLITKALLEGKADPNLLSQKGRSPLHMAIEGDSLSLAKALLEGGANSNLVDKTGTCPLHLAIQKGSLSIVKALLKKEARVTEVDGNGKTPLDYALKNGSSSILKQLEQHGVIVPSTKDRSQESRRGTQTKEGKHDSETASTKSSLGGIKMHVVGVEPGADVTEMNDVQVCAVMATVNGKSVCYKTYEDYLNAH